MNGGEEKYGINPKLFCPDADNRDAMYAEILRIMKGVILRAAWGSNREGVRQVWVSPCSTSSTVNSDD